MMAFEPGWFYSSLAQTSSSIVGLVGAVLGMHLIQHLTLMREERREIIDRVNLVNKQLRDRREHWNRFKQYLESEIERGTRELSFGNTVYQVSRRVTWEGEESETRVIDPSHHREEPEKELEILSGVMGVYPSPEGIVDEREITAFVSRLQEAAGLLPPHSKAHHILAVDAAALEKLRSRLARFRIKLFPRSFVVVLLVLAWLSVTGIIWPLSILPGVETYPQGIMLGALGLGVLGLVGYFAYQLRALVKLGRIYWAKP